jgi:putative DNA methylase
MPRSLIEQWFPAAIVGAESLRERGSAKAYPPVNFMHVWWARRPLTTSRAAIVASLLPAWPTDEEVAADSDAARVRKALEIEFPKGERAYHAWFVRTLGILGNPVAARARIAEARAQGTSTAGNAYGYDRAFTVTPDEQSTGKIRDLAALSSSRTERPVMLDPFAGGGSIPLEALRFGLNTVANDLNPVAAAILHGTIDLPHTIPPDFAKHIEHWGDQWARRVRERLAPYFPVRDPDERNAYIWAHTVPCPTTGRPTPLAPNFWLATGAAGRDVAIRLHPDHATGEIGISIVEGSDAREYGDRSTYSRGAAVSVWDENATLSGDDIRRLALEGHLGQLLLAVSVTLPAESGRQFRPPSTEDLDAIAAAGNALRDNTNRWDVDDLIPREQIPDGNDLRPMKMGLHRWADLFAPRQLLTMVVALEELRGVVAEAAGHLSVEEHRALALNLAFALDRCADYDSRLSSWHSSRMMMRNAFDRHDLSFKWTFAEFDGAATMIPWAVSNAATNFRNVAKLLGRPPNLLSGDRPASTTIKLGSATDLDLPDASVDVVVTDPPYYDNVQYAELADYFYVWLKRSLRDTWPELTTQVLTDKEQEAVANPALFRDVATHSGRGKRKECTVTAAELADQRYEDLLTASFKEAHRVLKPDGVMTVMFTHKRVDAWDTLGQALLEAGFEISSSWPVHTESEHSLHQAKTNSASSTILLGCRKRASTAPAYWEDIRNKVERAVEEAAGRFAAEGIKGVDLTLASYGPALSVLSRHWPVNTGTVDADGNPERLRPDVALDLARARVATLKKRGLLGGRDVDFDRPTDWWLLAWNDFQAATFPAGEALKLCIATDVELDDVLKEHKLASSAGGNVTLLTPAERRTAKKLHVDAGAWPSQVDALHALMLTYDEDGRPAAERWLDDTGRRDDQRFHDLFRAALHAVPRTRDGEGRFTRPEARILDSLRIALFDDVEAPVEESLGEIQGELFEQ